MTRRLGDEGDGASARLWCLRADSSTLSRRIRGVLSPSRERGNAALARPIRAAGFPSTREGRPKGVGSRFRGNDEAPGGRGRRGKHPVYGACAPTPVPSPAAFAASSPLIGRGGIRRLRACGRGATRPVSKSSPGPRHSRASGNLPNASPYAQAGTHRGSVAPTRKREPTPSRQWTPQAGTHQGKRRARESANLPPFRKPLRNLLYCSAARGALGVRPGAAHSPGDAGARRAALFPPTRPRYERRRSPDSGGRPGDEP